VTRRRALSAVVAGAALLLAAPAGLDAQELLRVFGAVQWVAGARMQLMMDNGSSIAVDLTQTDQSSYRALGIGERVVVDGVISPDGRRFVASAIWRDNGRGGWTQSP